MKRNTREAIFFFHVPVLLEGVFVITSGIVTLKYHDLILYAMVNTHLGIKDHTSVVQAFLCHLNIFNTFFKYF